MSLNSAQKYYYQRYFRPKNYSYNDVINSLRIAQKYHRWISLNYFMFPGFTDHRAEIAALENFLAEIKFNLIQARNLNIDPEWYIAELNLKDISDETMGIKNWIRYLQQTHPTLRFGYFNPPAEIVNPVPIGS